MFKRKEKVLGFVEYLHKKHRSDQYNKDRKDWMYYLIEITTLENKNEIHKIFHEHNPTSAEATHFYTVFVRKIGG